MKLKAFCTLTLALLILTTMMPSVVSGSSTVLEWESINAPGKDDNIVVSPSEISDFAVGTGGIVYAVDGEFSGIYRSDDAGISWEEMDENLEDSGAGLPASLIAIAPDNSNLIAVVTDSGSQVFISIDGGDEWQSTFVPPITGSIQAIAISSQYSSEGENYRDIAIVTSDWGDGNSTGELWLLQTGNIWATWENQELYVDPLHIGADISAIAFSSSYSRDRTLLAIASTGSDVSAGYQQSTFLCAGIWDEGTGKFLWDSIADYPVKIDAAGDAPGTEYVHASLALPSDYSSQEEETRQLLLSYDRKPDSSDDVYLIDNTTVTRLDIDDGNDIDICSIAYHGTIESGFLLAGETNAATGSLTVQVRRCEDPFDSSPIWHLASVPPTGPANARVAWSPDGKIAYCGTGQNPGNGAALDESALSASTDDGKRWRQMGLMDTVIQIADIAVTPENGYLYATSSSTFGPEGIWGSAGDPLNGHWYRLLTMDTDSNVLMLRLSPDYEEDDTLYVCEAGGNRMALSRSRGNTWEWHYAPGPVIDLVVEDYETIYVALPDGEISKSINRGRTWFEEPVETGLPGIAMLMLAPDGSLFAGGTNGQIAYSTDSGRSFTLLEKRVGSATGDVQVLCDNNFIDNNILYASVEIPDSGIWRWVINSSVEWEQIDEPITDLADGQLIGGLVMGVEGTLYGLRQEPSSDSSGGVIRSLNPTEDDNDDIEFELVNDALDAGTSFDLMDELPGSSHYPRLSGDEELNVLWALDSDNQLIYRFEDILCKTGPELDEPDTEDYLPVGPCSCNELANLFLGWDDLEGAKEYEAVICSDADCIYDIWTGHSDYACDDLWAAGGNDSATLTSDDTYYWQIRSIEPLISPWSEIRSFTLLLADTPDNVFPSSGATGIGLQPSFTWDSTALAESYEFVLAADSTFTNIIVDLSGDDALTTTAWQCSIELDFAHSYFWKVRAVSDTSYGDWTISTFTTMQAPQDAEPQLIQSVPTPPEAETVMITPWYIYAIVGLAAAVVIVLLLLIVKSGRYPR